MENRQQVTKKQHYVPQFYLRHFCDENGRVWVCELGNHKIFQTVPENICQEKYLYEVPWEESVFNQEYIFLNQQEQAFSDFESGICKLIDNLHSRCIQNENRDALICRKAEKEMIAKVAANFYLRNPAVFHAIEEDYLSQEPTENEEMNAINVIIEALKIPHQPLMRASIRKGIFSENINGSPTKFYTNMFLEMEISFLYNTDSDFLTSSQPVMVIENEEKGDMMVFFPLFPDLCVAYSNFRLFHNYRNRVYCAHRSAVEQINFLISDINRSDVRFIIASKKEHLTGIKRAMDD